MAAVKMKERGVVLREHVFYLTVKGNMICRFDRAVEFDAVLFTAKSRLLGNGINGSEDSRLVLKPLEWR